ncbi:hypothetical protein K492DRAFT_204880 [Lichtheimia hyalospora FSU 10163]|nr:hypothetical protein K492DRAFT_204880 [Lichtheimia hyalospora FSU 10163]
MNTQDRSDHVAPRASAHEPFDEDLGEALRNPDYLKLSNQLDETYNRKIEESELRRQYEVASIRQWSKVERQGIQNTFNNAMKKERQRIQQEILEKIAYLEAEMESLKDAK